MKNDRIDRERLFGPVQEEVHDRLRATLQSLEEGEPVKKMKYQPLLVALIILLLCGAAIAAVTSWDVRAALTRTDPEGNETVNETLVEMAQPIGTAFEGGAIRVEVTDAIFDGRSIIAAWTVTNRTDEMLYLSAEQAEESINWMDGAGSFGADRQLIQPGETLEGMMSRMLEEAMPTEGTVHVGIVYDVLRFATKTVTLDYPAMGYQDGEAYVSYEDAEARMAAYEQRVQEILSRGELPLAAYNGGTPTLPLAFLNEEMARAYDALEARGEAYTEADAYIETGAFERVEKLSFGFDLQVDASVIRSILPEGEPIEKDYGELTMRISRADVTPNTLEIIVDALYPDEETANRYLDGGPDQPPVSFIALDEAGRITWDDNSAWGVNAQEPVQLEDGRWMMQYHISHSEMLYLPPIIEVFPRVVTMNRDGTTGRDSPWDIVALPGLEEGIVLYAG